MMEREELNALRSAKDGPNGPEPEPENEADHFYICKACGQAVDKRRLGDVFHHEEAGHEPIPTNA
jgi:hypothetical protein